MAYFLDANVFIMAKNLHYGFDFCPAFWNWLIVGNSEGKVFSIEKVESEVLAIADELSDWAEARGSTFFLRPSEVVVPSLTAVSQWASSGGRYEASAISEFLQIADYYLIAHAHSGHHIVVSHEVPSASRKKIKIPNACIGLNIQFMSPYEMLRRERAKFVLG